MDEDHFLAPFLQERLPTLGLDAETYGSYVIGLLASSPEDEEVAVRDDEEEWNEILELLRASSESHGDDEVVWKELKADILQKLMDHQEAEKQRQAEEAAKLKEALKTPVITMPTEQDNGVSDKPKSSVVDDETKNLLRMYAYEDDEDGNDNDAEGDAAEGTSNREYAKKAELERAKELRNAKSTTKKEEQQKTKQAKLDKVQKLEERRKRSSKGERKR